MKLASPETKYQKGRSQKKCLKTGIEAHFYVCHIGDGDRFLHEGDGPETLGWSVMRCAALSRSSRNLLAEAIDPMPNTVSLYA
jgi:hypothetical protein